MEDRNYKDDLRKMILDMAQKELEGNLSQKGIKKYFEGNIDKIISENIKKNETDKKETIKYLKILKNGSKQANMQSVARAIKSEELFKSKSELVKFARYLGIKVNNKSSYNNILRKVSAYIYSNKETYASRYFTYKRGDKEYVIEPESIKTDLIESYKLKTRNDMKSIAKLLDIKVEEEDNAENIRKRVINYIMKEKLGKTK